MRPLRWPGGGVAATDGTGFPRSAKVFPRFIPALFTLAIRPSPILALALTAMAAAALACSWISLPLPAFLPAAAGIASAWWWHLAAALQRRRDAILAVELETDGTLGLQNRLGQWSQAGILPGGYVSTWLIVLSLAAEGGGRRSLVLLPDSAAKEDLRRLRVWLRWRLESK